MMRGLFTAATGMRGQQLNVDTIANNLANVNTTGYKKNRVNFQDLLYETIRAPGAPTTGGIEMPVGIQVGHGVRPASISRDFAQGNFIQTNNPLDMVIQGRGFFQITLPDGTTAYSRDGSFKRDSTGQVVTADGFLLEPAITIPDEALQITISSDGTVSSVIPGQPDPQNLFLETTASGTPITGEPGGADGAGTIEQSFLENSNVQVVEEIIHLIIAQRAYQANSNVIQTADEMLGLANSVKR